MAAEGLLVEIGDRLRARREELGLTQKEAAKLLKISETLYGEIERGNRSLSLDRLVLVHEKMGMSLTWLLCGEKTDSVVEGIIRRFPEEKNDIVERLLCNLARLYE